MRADVLKAVWLARFRRDMKWIDASEYWTSVHGPLGLRVPGMARYVQNHVVRALDDGSGELAFDGYACEWWPDLDTFRMVAAGPEWQAVVADGANVFEMDVGEGLAVDERLIIDGPILPFKVVWFARFKPDLDREEASRHWREEHGGIALEIPGIGRYLQNFVVSGLDVDGERSESLAYDGFSECWFGTEAEYLRATSSRQWERLVEDGYAFLDMESLAEMSGVVDERVIK
jgi:uncharacterized protein (TIGR02118 family)